MTPRAAAARTGEAPSTRDVLLDAAERCFADRGFAGVSVREIATEAGLKNQASLYHHFRDKQALYEAVLARDLEPVIALVTEAAKAVAGGAPPAGGAVVDSILDHLLDYLAAHPHLPRLIQRAALDDSRYLRSTLTRLLRPLYAEGMHVLAGAVGPWQPADLPYVAAGLYNLIFGYFASAALLEAVVEEDPYSPGAVERQRQFLKTAVAQLLGTKAVRRIGPNGPRRFRA
jgi:AcrR family transcriptional regulator